jgi:predicted lipid-binding transport protein (Tim44 family)
MKIMVQIQIFECLIALVLSTFSSAFAQKYNAADPDPVVHASFDKNYLISSRTTPDWSNVKSQLKADSTNNKRKIKIGKIVGFATMGFLSGLFFGASTDQAGFFQGMPVFHLKPALIGAAIGVIASFVLPDKKKRPSTSIGGNEKKSRAFGIGE